MEAEIDLTLLNKIKTLPAARRSEIEDFIDFLHEREQRLRSDVAAMFKDAFERLDNIG